MNSEAHDRMVNQRIDGMRIWRVLRWTPGAEENMRRFLRTGKAERVVRSDGPSATE